MKQWFSYRKLQSPVSDDKWGPEKVLENSFGSMNLTWCTGIGMGLSAGDARIVACMEVDDQSAADAVIDALSQFGAKKKTVTEAHDLLETLTGWDVTVNGDNLEATVNGESLVW